ncbi:MAG: hypothetical protein ACRDL8_21715 [Solirubrobacteraceae bacterium]
MSVPAVVAAAERIVAGLDDERSRPWWESVVFAVVALGYFVGSCSTR